MDFYDSLKHLPRACVKSLQEAQNKEPVHALLLNASKIADEDFIKFFPLVRNHPFIPHVYYYDKAVYDFGKSWLYDAGAISIQDPAAMLVPYYLDPKPGEKVLDLCAAPGGKTIFASLLMRQQGTILSNDLSYPRAKNLSQNVERMGLRNIIVSSDDFSLVYGGFAGFFDKIILDAPCSGSAMFRKDDESKADWSEEKVARCASIQNNLLEIVYACLKPGGRIVYSTCSFSYEENEGNLLAFLKAHPDMKPIPVENRESYHHPESLKEAVYLFPHLYEGEGQFFCLLEKEDTHASDFNHSLKKKPVHVDPLLTDLIKQFHFENMNVVQRGKAFYCLENPLPIDGLHLLRYGVELGTLDKRFEPSHAFARSVDPSTCIPLNKKEAYAYLSGETFPLDAENGYQVVSFHSCPLGWVKVVDGQAKNHYPKGLRYHYKD